VRAMPAISDVVSATIYRIGFVQLSKLCSYYIRRRLGATALSRKLHSGNVPIGNLSRHVLGQCVGWVACAKDLVESNVLGPNTLLDPELTDS
jgi:hypothetical protein